jgi:hypothetical protein
MQTKYKKTGPQMTYTYALRGEDALRDVRADGKTNLTSKQRNQPLKDLKFSRR